MEPVTFANLPAEHVWQLEAEVLPVILEALPKPQGVQAAEPCWSAYVPAMHVWQE